MVDEKKIKEAARNHVNVFRKANPDGYSSSIIDIESDCMDNFKAGAIWAQQEFIKSLWHDASEEPKKFTQIVIEIKNEKFTECITLQRTDDYMYDWEYSCQVLDISRWFYLSEILPKEGGEK